MVLNFPRPYPDEILYSIISRYYDYFGNSGPKQLLDNLFSSNTQSSTIDFPNNLNSLSNNIKSKYFTPDTIFSKHTLYPLYLRFCDDSKKYQIKEYALLKGGPIHTSLGINAGISKSLRLPRFCRLCYDDDIKKYGETYYRRAHQITTVKFCLKHKCTLEELIPIPEHLNKHQFVSANLIQNQQEVHLEFIKSNQIIEISNRLVALLNDQHEQSDFSDPYYYRDRLIEMGFGKGKRTINQELLYNSFQDYFSNKVLNYFNSSVNFSDESCWLKAIFRKHRKMFDPARHVLIVNFLENLAGKTSISSQQNETKYPCLNPACKHYNQSVFTVISKYRDSKSKREISIIKCSCGFCYTQSLMNNGKTFMRVKSYGQVWLKKLYELKELNHPIRRIARELHCDSKTVLNQLKVPNVKKHEENKTLIQKKSDWTELKSFNRGLTITELRKLNSSLYSYIYRHDPVWLVEQPYNSPKKKVKPLVDWGKRDEDLYSAIQSKHHYLLSTEYKKRISKTLLLKLTRSEKTYIQNKDKLPYTTKALSKLSETESEYRSRRIQTAIHELKMAGIPLKKWRICRRAGIRKEYISPDLDLLIERLISDSTIVISIKIA